MRDEGEELLGVSAGSSSGSTGARARPPPQLPAAALQLRPPRAAPTVCRPACALWQLRAVLVRNALVHTRAGRCALPAAPYYTLAVCDAVAAPPLPPPGTARAACALPGVLVHTSERAPRRANPDWRDIDRAALRAAAPAAAAFAVPALCVCVWDRAAPADADVLLAARVVPLRDLRFVAPLRAAETALAARQPFALLFVLGGDVYAPAADVLAVTAASPDVSSSDNDDDSSNNDSDGVRPRGPRLVAMCDAATLVALVGAHEARRAAREAAAAQRAALGAALARAGGTARLRAERDERAARVAHLERELAAQRALLRAEQEPCRAAADALVARAAALAAAETALVHTHAAHAAARPRRAALAAACAHTQHAVAQLQWRAVAALREPYPVAPVGSSGGTAYYTINGTALPGGGADAGRDWDDGGGGDGGGGNDDGSSSSSSGEREGDEDGEEAAAALGACAHVLARAAAHLGVPLAYPVEARGTRSHVADPCAPGAAPRRLPLYRRGADPAQHRAAVRLLQHDAALLLAAAAPAAAAALLPPGRTPSTLAALHALYEHAATIASAAPPPAPPAAPALHSSHML